MESILYVIVTSAGNQDQHWCQYLYIHITYTAYCSAMIKSVIVIPSTNSSKVSVL